MARQKGIIKLEGTIGDVSFYKSQDGYLARQKGGVDKERIKNDPAFQRTRENGSEFGRAGRAGRTLRTALRLLLQNASDSKVASRLTREMLRVIKSDEANDRGERSLVEGDLEILNGFDFNINGKLSASLYAGYEVAVDRAAGMVTISMASFAPANTISCPSGATHLKLVAGVAEVNFVNEVFKFAQAESPQILIDQTVQENLELSPGLTANSVDDVFIVLGIDFMQQVNGNMYPLKNGSFNPLAIVKIDRPDAPIS